MLGPAGGTAKADLELVNAGQPESEESPDEPAVSCLDRLDDALPSTLDLVHDGGADTLHHTARMVPSLVLSMTVFAVALGIAGDPADRSNATNATRGGGPAKSGSGIDPNLVQLIGWTVCGLPLLISTSTSRSRLAAFAYSFVGIVGMVATTIVAYPLYLEAEYAASESPQKVL